MCIIFSVSAVAALGVTVHCACLYLSWLAHQRLYFMYLPVSFSYVSVIYGSSLFITDYFPVKRRTERSFCKAVLFQVFVICSVFSSQLFLYQRQFLFDIWLRHHVLYLVCSMSAAVAASRAQQNHRTLQHELPSPGVG